MKDSSAAGSSHIKDYRKTLNLMFERNQENFIPLESDKQKVLISCSYGDKRAATYAGTGNTIQTAYESARNTALKSIRESAAAPTWTCMSFVTKEEKVSKDEFYERVTKTRANYYRYGIALDEFYQAAFPEQELNGANLFDYKQEPVVLSNNRVTKLLRQKGIYNSKRVFAQEGVDNVIVFDAKACFFDTEKGEYHDLHTVGTEKGIRDFGIRDAGINSEFWLDQIEKTCGYLASTLKEDGSFIYGYFPCFGGIVPGYNMIRHILSVLALIDCYEFFPDSVLMEKIKRAYEYVIREAYKEVDRECSVIVDHANDDEIRLGALGLAILMILKYSDLAGGGQQLEAAKKLANFILKMQDPQDGGFTHVLQYPDLSVKQKFKIVYYPGEACYGLMALYDREKDERYLDACKRAFDYFIENDYHKYFDHWLAYAANEVTKYAPEDRIFEFGIKNALGRIDFIIERETTYATFLEMLNASRGLFERVGELGKDCLFDGYDTEKFYRAIDVRAKRQLEGVMFPETAMFFENPAQILYGVYIRHHSFRVRDDDVAHHLIGYCNYLKNSALPGAICTGNY